MAADIVTTFGTVLHDAEGRFVVSLTVFFSVLYDPLMAKTLLIREVLSWISQKGGTMFMLSQIVRMLLLHRMIKFWEYVNIV
ncbi:hypothetical protein ES332_A08G100600v1 [Gossypium tomentosum]|uniref:Uncharacterized protein n=1 Tax=Gossypium tomentosum TaxID=34277 RepID=A0A5D2PCT6_GOSTO|nr:hypothetical protein ES332_A08G100600v1 [Gossypium tomentosum]